MKDTNTKKPVTAVLILLVSILFLIGMMTLLSPCGPREDGSFMSCHQAGQALRILSGLSVIVSAAALFQRAFARIADIVLILLGIAAIAVPGNIIHLCMMPEMRCRAVMKPGAMVFAILLIVLAAADLLIGNKKKQV